MVNGSNSCHDGSPGGGGNNGGGRHYGGGGSECGRKAADARGEPFNICDSRNHFARKRPKLLCQDCKKKGHGIIYCKDRKNVVMEARLTGGGTVAKEKVVEMDDESTVRSEAECDAFTIILEDGTGEGLLSYGGSGGSEGQTQRVGNKKGLLDAGASGHSTDSSTRPVGYAECNRTLRCTGGATCPIVGADSLEIPA